MSQVVMNEPTGDPVPGAGAGLDETGRGGRKMGSLRRRLSLWLAIQSLAVLSMVCGVVYAVTHLNFESRQEDALRQKQAQVRHLLTEATSPSDVDLLRHKLDDFSIGRQDLALSLLRPDGSVFYSRPSDSASATHARTLQFEVPAAVTAPERLTAILTLDTAGDQRVLQRLALTLFAAALTGAALISAGGFALVRLGLRPVRDLVEQTQRLAADTLHRRLDGSGQAEELAPLIEQFNALLGRLSQAYEQLEGFNADVAHELCTPLATLISSTELALRRARSADDMRDTLGSNLEELQRLAGIVQDMLFLSQADRGSTARRDAIGSLAAVARNVAEYHEAALEEAGLHLDVNGDCGGAVDVPLLQRALSNLLANAVRYAEPGSTVRIHITELGADVVQLSVSNRGATIDAAHLPLLFQRFFRADPSRSGAHRNHGLGLAIVAAIARMHGGSPLARSAHGVTTIGFTLRLAQTVPTSGDTAL